MSAAELPPITSMQRELTERALAAVDRDFFLRLLKTMVETPSPTGEERRLAERLVDELQQRGISAEYQAIGETRGNCIGRLSGSGGGRDLLVYGHLDPTFSTDRAHDRAVLGDAPRPDMEAKLVMRDDGLMTGLGIANPKGSMACAIAAVDAIARTGTRLAGDVILGLVAGGIHTRPFDGLNRRFEGPHYQGFGIGCEYMLKHGVTADYALSTKPGFYVAWEEPGECWFVVEVKGTMSYAGIRHQVKPRNSLVDAAGLVTAIEAWLPDYTQGQTRGQLSPQGAVGAIEGGWPYKPEFMPAVCNVYVSLNCHTDTPPLEARRIFERFLDQYRKDHPGVDLNCRMLVSEAGSRTDPANWIVQSCRRALETVEGRKLADATGLSGTSDTNILRHWGIPTVRLGLPKLTPRDPAWPPMFDAVRLNDLYRTIDVYIRTIIDTCGRVDW